jgi:aromatic ring hydroxylase
MALKTAQEYLDTIKKLSPRVYCGGKWVKNLLSNKVTRSTRKLWSPHPT